MYVCGWVGGLHRCVCVCECEWVGGWFAHVCVCLCVYVCVCVLGLMYDEETFGPNISQVATGGLCLLFSTCCAE